MKMIMNIIIIMKKVCNLTNQLGEKQKSGLDAGPLWGESPSRVVVEKTS